MNVYAILSVKHKSEKDSKFFECDSPASMNNKINELQSLPQTVEIGVFLCSQIVKRTERWEASPYAPPGVVE